MKIVMLTETVLPTSVEAVNVDVMGWEPHKTHKDTKVLNLICPDVPNVVDIYSGRDL